MITDASTCSIATHACSMHVCVCARAGCARVMQCVRHIAERLRPQGFSGEEPECVECGQGDVAGGTSGLSPVISGFGGETVGMQSYMRRLQAVTNSSVILSLLCRVYCTGLQSILWLTMIGGSDYDI